MKILIIIIIGLIILVIVGALVFGYFIIVSLAGVAAAAAGISHKYKTEKSVWEYWGEMKIKSWNELSDAEKEKLVVANMIIADDIGVVTSEDEVRVLLEQQLPILEPNTGLNFNLKWYD